jgi:Ni2+-binding GTPase involved in maturation of urease and hydrogenase
MFLYFIIKHYTTGGCPHAAIREDITANVVALESLTIKFKPELLIVESGGDNLAANYSRELADCIFCFLTRSKKKKRFDCNKTLFM